MMCVMDVWWTNEALQAQNGPVMLDAKTFEHHTQAATGQTTGKWFVLFRAHVEEGRWQNDMEKVWMDMADRWKNEGTIFAYADLEGKNGLLAKRFGIQTTTALYFANGMQYEYQEDATQGAVETFLKGGYKQVEGAAVRPPPHFWEEYWMEKLAPAMSILQRVTAQNLALVNQWKVWIYSGVFIVVGIVMSLRMLR